MYNFKKIEKKWQDIWESENAFEAITGSPKPKYYYLVEFPYPSGSGLHVGHVRSYAAHDAMARKKRMQGYNVLFPMGWDSFGSPAEQYAIENNIHPKDAVYENVKVFTYPNTKEYLGLAIGKDNKELQTEINKAIADLKASGEFNTLYKKWFNTDAPADMPVVLEFK